MKQAVIDLGTNTFHLMIVRKKADHAYETLFRESRPAKIGRAVNGDGGINQGVITDDAIDRALGVLTYFRQVLDEHQIAPADVAVFGTSAIRVAQNQQAFVDRVRDQTGLLIRVISGDEEAGLIYRGVRASGALSDETALIVDIGGGSVEFIIAGATNVGRTDAGRTGSRDAGPDGVPKGSGERIRWKQSFEIGGQRLMERFMGESDKLSPAAVRRLQGYLQEQLLPLTNAIHQYHPTVLVGSSGTFDTLIDMQYQHEAGVWPPADQSAFSLPLAEFYRSYELLLTRNHDERMALPGMIELRVDMIVVAVVLIDFVLRTYGIRSIRVSTYALKEGALAGE